MMDGQGTTFCTSTSLKSQCSKLIDDDDAYLVTEGGGFLAQYFLAISLKHPIMYFALQTALQVVLGVPDYQDQYVPRTTGPAALGTGYRHFMRNMSRSIFAGDPRGFKVGVNNRTARIVNTGGESELYVKRFAFNIKDKRKFYETMDMKPFDDARTRTGVSCFHKIYHDLNLTKYT